MKQTIIVAKKIKNFKTYIEFKKMSITRIGHRPSDVSDRYVIYSKL